jgi:hypothetical protein
MSNSSVPHPHGDKLEALLQNDKLPSGDGPRIEHAIARYEEWLRQLEAVQGTRQGITAQMVSLLDGYKRYVEVELFSTARATFSTARKVSSNWTTPSSKSFCRS